MVRQRHFAKIGWNDAEMHVGVIGITCGYIFYFMQRVYIETQK